MAELKRPKHETIDFNEWVVESANDMGYMVGEEVTSYLASVCYRGLEDIIDLEVRKIVRNYAMTDGLQRLDKEPEGDYDDK